MSELGIVRDRLKFLGIILVAAATLIVPFVYAGSSYIQTRDALNFKAGLGAERVAKYIYTHGDMWTYHRIRLIEIIQIRNKDSSLHQRVVAGEDKTVADEGDELQTPMMMASAPIMVGNKVVGRFEASTSARPLLITTSLIACLSLIFGLIAYSITARVRLLLLDNALERLGQHEEQLASQNAQFSAALEGMPQGLAMFDADRRLLICNKTYASMYGFPDDFIKRGTTLRAIMEYRIATGMCPENTDGFIEQRTAELYSEQMIANEQQLLDGRIILVLGRPMSNGGVVVIHMDVTEKRHAEKRIEYLARHDELTGLANRALLRERIENDLAQPGSGREVAVLCLDLDRFKHVNDALGHSNGDVLLQAVARRLCEIVPEDDLIARTGSDEFAVVSSQAASPEHLSDLAARIIRSMSAPIELGDSQVNIGVSVGIAVGPQDGSDSDRLLKNADLALYRAKAVNRGNFSFFEPAMDAKAQARRVLETDLRDALQRGEFEMYYQPVVNLEENKISGFEALLRWHHPTKGLVSPSEFIPLAEETGLIVPLGEWVIRKACGDAQSWPSDIRVAVNVSPTQFLNNKLTTFIVSALAASGLAPNRLEVEITESVLMKDNEATLATLHQLRGMGVRIAMDDFGTGYSSLSYVRSFPFDKIKIDQCFVRDLKDNPDSISIIRAVTGIGESFGMTTTVEGVETQEQLDTMRSEGCNEVQGFFYSKPMPLGDVPALLAKFAERARDAA
jgi:diguanylate cyclase (GGDEF)-like protein